MTVSPFKAASLFVNLPPGAPPPQIGSVRPTPVGCGAARGSYSCTGFAWQGGAGGANEATFAAVPSGPVPVGPSASAPALVRVARVGLLNGGALLPADAGAALVRANATLVVEPSSPAGAGPLRVPVGEFSAYWTPGSPAPPNEAGVFRLAKIPAPVTFALAGATYSFRLEGMRLQPQDRMAGTVPWPARLAQTPGQPAPASGLGPSLSVYQPRGEQASVVELVGSIVRV